MLAEFPSAVDAVKCAVEVQQAIGRLDESDPEDQQLRFRIGVHVGDVVVQGSDLLGDAINIASRLQSLADPGAVCLSGPTHEYVRRSLPLSFDDLGLQNVRNIDEPIRVYAIRWEVRPQSSVPHRLTGGQPSPPTDRPSIAVLPFATTTVEDEYLGDGISDDVITALSKMRWLFVIGRNSSFAFKGRALDTGQIARQLGVVYVLTGSVRRSGERVRISVQLVDAPTGASFWAERYERDLGDIFALQDEIAQEVAGAIEPELLKTEGQRAARKADQNPTAWDLVRRGMWEFHKVRPESHIRARDLFLQAIAAAPESIDGYIWLARVDAGLIAGGWTEKIETTANEGMTAALTAVQLDEKNPYAHYAVAITHSFAGKVQRAQKAGERAIALSPSFALGHLVLGLTLMLLGQPQEGVRELKHGLRLNPFDPHNFYWHLFIALGHYVLNEPVQGLEEARVCLEIRPHWAAALRLAAACELGLGNHSAARQLVSELKTHGDPSGDVLANVLKHRPEWIAEIDAKVQELADAVSVP